MTTRAERIKRRNAKREKEFFRIQKLVGLFLILSGIILLVTENDMTWLVCVGLPAGLGLVFTKQKVFEDYHEYEEEL
ncbi:MAG: hypothetical protein IKZ01_00060 [Anaerotignum sp.]|nr:hypothetical protein [Anaerotignum sp.]